MNQATVAPDATVTVAGTATVVLLLETLTFNPPVGAAAFKVIEHESFTKPLTDALLHESEINPGVVLACVCLVVEAAATVLKSASGQKQIKRSASECADEPFSGLRP